MQDGGDQSCTRHKSQGYARPTILLINNRERGNETETETNSVSVIQARRDGRGVRGEERPLLNDAIAGYRRRTDIRFNVCTTPLRFWAASFRGRERLNLQSLCAGVLANAWKSVQQDGYFAPADQVMRGARARSYDESPWHSRTNAKKYLDTLQRCA
jgi:hypothetical protein